MVCMIPAVRAAHCREVTGFRAPHFKTNNLLGQVLVDLNFQCVLPAAPRRCCRLQTLHATALVHRA